ncbi:phage tail protein, partial [Lactococcus formosensis]|uniref:phage tail protein n=1 Tax=Lactococcus formosensis TaxID=1281486 RepID=UPI00254DC245
MLISIHDQTLQRVGFLSNENPLTPDFKNDKFHRYLAQGAATFDFTVNKRKNGVLQDYMQHLNEHAYFSFQYEGEDFLFDSVIVEENDDEVTFNCLTLNLEMRNEEVKKLENSTSHNIQWYFDKMGLINFAQIKLGKNEVSDYTRVIKYDSEDTKLSRLISVIQNFDGEFEFVTKLKRDGTLDNITLNLYKKNDGADIQGVGQNRNDVILTFGENVTGVSRKVDKSQIFNGLYVTGKDGLSWKDKAWSVKNAEGVEEFYKRAGESYAKAPLSAQMFPAQIQSTKGDIWTIRNKETEYTSPEAMWGYALSELRKNAYPLVEYEVQATSGVTVSSLGDGTPLHIGDTVRIQDMNFMDSNGDVGLFLSARVSELEISFTNPTNNKITFSNYVKLKSEVSDDLLDRMQSIIDQNTPYRSEIMTTNGIQFKNGTGTTDLSAHIFKGADAVETVADAYTWFRDGTPMAQTQTITVSATSVPEKAVYSYEAKINGAVVGTASVTITNVNDGKDGSDGIAGKDGLGIKSTDITYAISTNSTTPPTSGWTSSVPTLTKGKYLWTRTVWNYTDNSSETGYSVTYISKDGNDGNDGIAGKDGVGIKLTTITYAKSTSGTTQPTTGWTSTVPTVPAGQFLWTKTVWDYTDSTSETGYSVAKMGDNGTDGKDGNDGKTYYPHTAYAYSADGKEGFTTLYPHLNLEQHTEMLVDDSDKLLYGGKGGATATMTHEYVSIPGLPTVKNAVHITQTTKGQSGWSSQKAYSFPVVAGEEYIFSAYVKNNRTDTLSIGIYCGATADFNGGNPKYFLAFQDVEPSNNFVLITQVIVIPEGYNYAWSYIYTNGTTVNADYEFCGFKVEKGTTATPWMPSASEVTTADWPRYIGQYTDFTQADSTNPSDYTWSLIRGNDGVGIKATVITYAISTSGTTAPTTSWTSQVPTLVKGLYLWTKTVWTYTDNSSETGYSVTYISKDGNDGKDGIAGKDGVGIKLTTITYAKSTSGTTQPTTGWTSTVPTVPAGQFLWTKTVWDYTDSTSETGYSV